MTAQAHGSRSGSVMLKSSMLENEKKALEKIKMRQQKEVQQMMDHEIKMAAIK